MSRHVVVGAGPVGSTVATQLANQGHQVRVVTRSGSGPKHPSIELVRGDASDAASLSAVAAGAEVLFNCVNPPYTKWASAWPSIAAAFIAAAESSGARLVITGNLYGYGEVTEPMRPTTPLAATGTKGATRVAMWRSALQAHEQGRLQAVEVRAGDFFGPLVAESAAMGDRVVPNVLAGKKVQVMASADTLHSWSYMPDVAATLIAVGLDPTAFGRAWHVPSHLATARQLIEAFSAAAGRPAPKISVISKGMLNAIGLVSPTLRELKETFHQFANPFEIDATETTQRFGITPTPLNLAASTTVAWNRQRS